MSSNTRKRSNTSGQENALKRRRREGTEDPSDARLTDNDTDHETGKENDLVKDTGEVIQVGEQSESDDEDCEEESDSYGDEEDEESDIEHEFDQLKESNPEAYEVLQKVHQEIHRTEPSIQELLSTPLRLEDRAKLCQLYEIYKSHIPNTEESLDARNRYNEMFKEYKAGYTQYNQYSEEEITAMSRQEARFTGFNAELSLKYKILQLNADEKTKQVIFRRYEEMMSLEHSDDQYSKLKNWLVWATEIPHNTVKQINIEDKTSFIRMAKEKLDNELYGMNGIKEQILLFLNTKLCNPNAVHANLGLVGPPGVGKTHIGRLIAEIMDWGFSQISFGGTDKADFLKGHEYTYVGAQPGEIVKSLKRIGHKNGVIFLDELDKIADNPDIRAALLHLIDPTQNADFKDLFLSEISIDLSQVWWVGSMNSIPADEALADRWWIINVEGYAPNDKIQIIEKHLLPRALKNCSLPDDHIILGEGVTSMFIEKICKSHDKGVRTLEKGIKDLVNKIVFILSHQDKDGKLPFKTSFELGSYLEKPVKISKQLLDKVLESKELNSIISLQMMYI
jgi:ATP-dependent Lon protease